MLRLRKLSSTSRDLTSLSPTRSRFQRAICTRRLTRARCRAMQDSPGFLVPRAASLLKPAPVSYGAAFARLKEQGIWSPQNPDGSILLGIAENKISSDILHERIAQLGPFPADLMGYQARKGMPELRQAIKNMLETTFMKGVDVDPNHLTCTAGAGSVVDLLFYCIAGAGDGVLIPAPYYPAFDNDLSARNSVVPVPVYLHPRNGSSLGAQLDAAAAAAAEAGDPIRALLFTNPSNPLGTVTPEEELREMLAWCLKNQIHFVSDEVYALSLFGSEGPPFVSVAPLAAREAASMPGGENADDLVHIIFGMSKDFCASGLRLGCLHSRNRSLNILMLKLVYFALPSAPVQWMFSQIFNDTQFLSSFLQKNRSRMAHSYELLTGAIDALEDLKIPYVPATAAMFLWIDLREGMREPTWEEEASLWQYIVDRKRLLLTPGRACHAEGPGFFRVCWAWMPADALPVAVQRIAEAMREHRVLPPAATFN